MLPLQQAFEVRSAIEEYLKATFVFREGVVQKAFYDFINNPEEGIFKGPYISLKLPFVADVQGEIPLEIAPDFPPYRHQFQSFQRLSTADDRQPEATIITTGTSSGKTESFLYPLLDYCYKHRERPGIKAIILYPMNALATDQAKRLAEIIWKDEHLKGITAGLFIGEGSGKAAGKSYHADMGPDHVIEARKNIVESPPDILLTNFKMLDYGLMKGEYDTLWTYNYTDTTLLRFLVLDELHTYDGAQGTDVANLIRRLKLKLSIPPGQLCPVGTSATIGSTTDAMKELVKYASRVFGEAIDETAVLVENRLELEDFLPEPKGGFFHSFPHPHAIVQSRIGAHETFDDFLQKQKQLWQLDPQCRDADLSKELKKLQIVKDLLSITGKGILHFEDLKKDLALVNTSFGRLSDWDAVHQFSPRDQVLQSLLALLAAAKTKAGSQVVPFLYLQVQLWIRELTGVLRSTSPVPRFTWKANSDGDEQSLALPAYHCRECGSSGWLAVRHDNKPDQLEVDANAVYDHFFGRKKNLYFLNLPGQEALDEYIRGAETLGRQRYLEADTLHLSDQPQEGRMEVVGYRTLQTSNNNFCRLICPQCNTEDSVSIIGTRIATLSSITVSQVLSSDLDPRSDRERKILAFTNSVQDAAHQAGFVEARNYRFTFRSSLQQVINEVDQPISLPQLQQRFLDYWREHADNTGDKDTEAFVYRFFPADYRGRVNLMADYRDAGTKRFTRDFLNELNLRLTWEIASEFGYNAQVGRTLEKTGASAVYFDHTKIENVFPLLEQWLTKNGLSMIDAAACGNYVHGILQRLRIRGGIDHEYLSKYRSKALNRWDLNWNKDSRHFLNKYFGKRTRMPRLLVTTARPGETVDTTFSQGQNWFTAYFRKSFSLTPTENVTVINEFHEQLIKCMEEARLLNVCEAGETKNYAIRPESLMVQSSVSIFQCDHCNGKLHTAASNAFAPGTACLDYTCPGRYEARAENKLNYYQQVYNRAKSPRIYAAEHTGMLPRERREAVEFSFKERPQFNSLNTLVATSTLEMGINIGTLNTVLNNSVPPTTANFLQRVGRAGRSSGAALVTNFAKGQSHDLYHFEEPVGMMDGDIGTPGCFLEAKEILRRHFLAFCLDCWAKEEPMRNRFPNRISFMSLQTADLNDPDFVICRLTSFIKANEQAFVSSFREVYLPDELDDEVFEPLQRELRSDDWYRNIRKVFENLKQELADLTEKQREIELLAKDKHLAPTDPEYLELKAEVRALSGIKKVIQKRSPVEHLTNRGFLPNYAFPETGVKLQASIRAYAAKGSEAPPVHEEFEIVRDAATALKELAPSNDFYSLGYKFHISGLNTYDWKDASVLLTKRFCSNCDHIENEAMAAGTECPKCGDASWSAESNKHKFVKLTGVKSSNKREEATLDDSSEERKPVFYRRTRHLCFDKNTSCGAWGMKDIPFGIEYVRHVTSTDVNLGDSKVMHSNRIQINGEENVPRHGFIACKYCGKTAVQAELATANEGHYAYCKHKEHGYTGDANDGVFEEVFLYREVETEALKILLPVQEFDSFEQIELFKAGIEAGLRLFYKGDPGHISMWDYREYNRRSQRFDRYLVLFDTIPGGTGYLEKLFNTAKFSELLLLAYNHIKNCTCQHKGKKGCYRCIYTYRNQFVRDSLSRAKAEELFEKIVVRLSDWEPYTDGLGSLSGSGQIEESELEDRFVRSLKNKAKTMEASGWKWEERRDGTIRYFLTLPSSEKSLTWQITPQVTLGPGQGVSLTTRADFLFSLVEAKSTKEGAKTFTYDEAPHWAIYLDGYAYHAQRDNIRFYNDVARRRAIVESGKYKSWTLTWRDLDSFDNNIKPGIAPEADNLWLNPSRYQQAIAYYRKTLFGKFFSEIMQAKDSLERFLWFLRNPFAEDDSERKVAVLIAAMQERLGHPSFNAADATVRMFQPPDNSTKAANPSDCYMLSGASLNASFALLNVALYLQQFKTVAALKLTAMTDDLPKDAWEHFWQAFNLVQHSLIDDESSADTDEEALSRSEILQYYDEELHGIVIQLIDAGIPVNPEGSFFLDEAGFEAAEAGLGLKDRKLFINPISDDDRMVFLSAGYTEISVNSFNIDQWI